MYPSRLEAMKTDSRVVLNHPPLELGRPSCRACEGANRVQRSLGRRQAPRSPDDIDDTVHDLGKPEVLRGEYSGDPHRAQYRRIAVGDDATDDDGQITGAGCLQTIQHSRNKLHVGARQDREAYTVNVLVDCGSDDLFGCEPNALVDDLKTCIAGAHRDLLSTVAVSVKARLANQDAQPLATLFTRGTHPLAYLRQLAASSGLGNPHRARNPCGRTVLAEHVPQRLGPLPRGKTGPCSL